MAKYRTDDNTHNGYKSSKKNGHCRISPSMTAKILKFIWGYLAVSVICTGCYPRPHNYIESPAISGVLIKGGIPAAGVDISLAHTRGDDGNYCRNGRIVAVTGKDGKFHIDPSIHTHLFTSLLNPPNTVFQDTSVCFEMAGQQKLGVVIMARTDLVKSFELSCELDSAPLEFKQDVVWSADKWGVCTNPS